MTYSFICYLETLQVLLLILCSSGRNIRGVTEKQMKGAVLIFVLFLFEKYFPQKIFPLLFSALFRSFTDLTMPNVLFS
jgi:hypothetical protein